MAPKEGGKKMDALAAVGSVVFSQSYGDIGRELLQYLKDAMTEGMSPVDMALPLHRAIQSITNGMVDRRVHIRERGLANAQAALTEAASNSVGKQKTFLETLSVFIRLEKGTLASRLHELQKLLGYLLSTAISDAAAKSTKRKRDVDEDDEAAGKGPSKGAMHESMGVGKSKEQRTAAGNSGQSKGRVRARATRKSLRRKAADQDMEGVLLTLLRVATAQESLPDYLQDTASSGPLNIAEIFM